MTEHSAVIFVFFFLAEYASIVLMCITVTILFAGGYNFYLNVDLVLFVLTYTYEFVLQIIITIYYILDDVGAYIDRYVYSLNYTYLTSYLYDSEGDTSLTNYFFLQPNNESDTFIINSYIYSFVLAIKSLIMIFIFIWVRASFPRIRYDQLMSYCWTVMLPIVFALIIFVPCIIHVFYIIPANITI